MVTTDLLKQNYPNLRIVHESGKIPALVLLVLTTVAFGQPEMENYGLQATCAHPLSYRLMSVNHSHTLCQNVLKGYGMHLYFCNERWHTT